jgi:hypothetical protein
MERLRMKRGEERGFFMSKYNMRILLGLTVAFTSGLLAIAETATAQAQVGYVASGEVSGGSVVERAAVNRAPQAVPGTIFAYSSSADVTTGAYTDPSANVRLSLQREHLVLGHPYAVGAAPTAPATVSPGRTAPAINLGKDISILSQH